MCVGESGMSYECFLQGWVSLEGHSWQHCGEVVVAAHCGFVASLGVIARVTGVFGSRLWWC